MYGALNEEGRFVYAQDVRPFQGMQSRWYCPKCRQLVQFVSRRGAVPHYRHLTACGQEAMNSHPGESEAHQAFKRVWLDYFREKDHIIEDEVSLMGIDRQADIMIDQQLIVEYQRSPISAELLIERTKDYMERDYRTLWVIDNGQVRPPYHHQWLVTNLHHHPSLGYYWLTYDENRKCLVWYFQLPLIFAAFQCQKAFTELNMAVSFDPRHIQKEQFSFQSLRRHYDPHKRRIQLRLSPHYQAVYHWWYERGKTIEDVPNWILETSWQLLGIKTSGWITLASLNILCDEDYTHESIQQAIQWLIHTGNMTLHPTPFIAQEHWLDDVVDAVYRLFQHQQS